MKKCFPIVLLSFAAFAAPLANGKKEPFRDMPEEFKANPAEVVELARGVTGAKYPDADMAYVRDCVHTEYNADGTETCWNDEYAKALTEKGRRNLSSLAVHFTERYGDAKILAVELIGTNGAVRKVDFEKNMKIVTDNDSMGANIYDPLDKKIVCTIPGVEPGDIRRVLYCRRTLKARMKGTWCDYNVFEFTAPIVSSTVTVSQPDENPVKHAVLRSPLPGTVTKAEPRPFGKGRTLYRWDVRNVPQAFPEPNMPPMYTQVQRLIMSTLKDWREVSKWYWNLCLPRLAASNAAMTNKVEEIVSGESSREGKIRGLFKFVSQEIRYMGITDETEAPGYEPHDVKLTFDNRYGVCRDKAALLAEMLRIAGIKAFPVLINVGAKMDPDVPRPYFNHAIVGVECEGGEIAKHGKYMLMDPTNESTRDIFPAYLSNKSYIVARPEGEDLQTSQIVPVEKNMYRVESKGCLSPDGSLVLESEMSFGGINDTYYRRAFLRRTDRDRRRLFERWLQGVSPGAELLSLKISPKDLSDTETPLSASLSVRFPQVLLKGKSRAELQIPFLTKSVGIADMLLDENTALETRRFPLVLAMTAGWEEKLSVELGEETGKAIRIPDDVNVRTAGGGYSFVRKISVKDGMLNATRALRVGSVEFDPSEYLELREKRKLAESGERASPVFSAGDDANADVKILASRKTVHFVSPKVWTVTNTVEKEILTYSGKKSFSELKFVYTPLVKSVEVVEASVSNRNGVVKRASSRETNVMDGSGAGEAPRYPASKIMVVNLPGVETGSVIRVTSVETVTNSPVAYSEFNAFGAKDPVAVETYEYYVPEGMRFNIKGAAPATNTLPCGTKRYFWKSVSPERIPNEPSQPGLGSWRKSFTVSAADWRETGMEFVSALEKARDAGSEKVRETAEKLTEGLETPEEKIGAIRKFISETVRLAGPEMTALPFDSAFFPPDEILSQGYASPGDRLNLFATMLEASGFGISILMSAADAKEVPADDSKRRKVARPGGFMNPVIRAVRSGRTFWLSSENEYVPAQASSKFDDSYYDPETDTFGKVGEETDHSSWILPWKWFAGSDCARDADGGKWMPKTERTRRLSVRENGTVDFDVTNRVWGSAVGAWRKSYEEMLPEKRSRHFREMLGDLAANATATRELETDTKGYPFVQSYSACVPDFAVAKNGELSLNVPAFTGDLFAVGTAERKTPVKIAGCNPSSVSFEIVFPEGYTQVEFMPESFKLYDPSDKNTVWIEHSVKTNVVGDVLRLTVTRKTNARRAKTFRADYAPYFREWNRKAASPAVRTVAVRKEKSAKGK